MCCPVTQMSRQGYCYTAFSHQDCKGPDKCDKLSEKCDFHNCFDSKALVLKKKSQELPGKKYLIGHPKMGIILYFDTCWGQIQNFYPPPQKKKQKKYTDNFSIHFPTLLSKRVQSSVCWLHQVLRNKMGILSIDGNFTHSWWQMWNSSWLKQSDFFTHPYPSCACFWKEAAHYICIKKRKKETYKSLNYAYIP